VPRLPANHNLARVLARVRAFPIRSFGSSGVGAPFRAIRVPENGDDRGGLGSPGVRAPDRAIRVPENRRRPGGGGGRSVGGVKVYTRKGDDGTTGLYGGGRVAKDSAAPEAYGTVDEAQSALGLARAFAEPGGVLDTILVGLERDLWVLMSELATDPGNRHKLKAGATLVTAEMVEALEARIDEVSSWFDPPTEFVVPGVDRVASFLDVARAVVRRAERRAAAAVVEGSQIGPYLNRLSDLVWTLARWQEGTSLTARDHGADA
jgi:cob(I)alamin adenosyltransferase